MFVIKVVATATEKNKNFQGEVHTYYYGKQEKLLSEEGLPVRYFVDSYGFKTKAAACSAMKVWKETQDWFEQFGTWTHERSVIEIPT